MQECGVDLQTKCNQRAFQLNRIITGRSRSACEAFPRASFAQMITMTLLSAGFYLSKRRRR